MGLFQGGYAGKLLYVDLTDGSVQVKPLERDFALKYIGGRGFSASILHDELLAGVDPLSPDNVIVFAADPERNAASFRQPSDRRREVSGDRGIGDASSGGYWARRKYAGFDAIIFRGDPQPGLSLGE
jgi:aldehyde:ferredoxin oxidoreductase